MKPMARRKEKERERKNGTNNGTAFYAWLPSKRMGFGK